MKFLKKGERPVLKKVRRVDSILRRAVERKGGTLMEHEAYEVFSSVGIAVPRWHFHPAKASVARLSKELPRSDSLVAKAIVEGVVHRTERGAILMNLNRDDAPRAVAKFKKRFRSKLVGVLFVELIEHDDKLGSELLLGLCEDDFFGKVIAFGLGGTGVEYVHDLMRRNAAQTFIPADANIDSMEGVIAGLPAAQILEGRVRGFKKRATVKDIKRVLKAFQDLGRYYSKDNPKAAYEIVEAEINPLVIDGKGFTALDGVLRVKRNDRVAKAGKPIRRIANLLNPKSVALVGVSATKSENPSNIILKKFLKAGVPRRSVLIVHPKEREIDGIACVKDVGALVEARDGKPVDCMVVGVPARAAGSVVGDAFRLGAAKSVQIISSGFGETRAGARIQREMSRELHALDGDAARRPVVNGPNTLGNIYHNVNTLFTPRYKSSATGKGKQNVALICQSGAFLVTRISDMANVISPKIAVSVGNQMDLSVTDFFEYLLGEEDIDCYGLYIEGMNAGDGRRLIRLIDEARSRGKFVIIYKSGRTEAGAKATRGHTAALAGDYDMFVDFATRSGAIVANTAMEFDDLVVLASYCDGLAGLKRKRGRKLGVAALSNAGFEKCALTDHLTANNRGTFEFANYSKQTRAKFKRTFDALGVSSIVDQTEVFDLSPMTDDEGYERIARAALADASVDFGLFAMVPETVMLTTCEASEMHAEDMMKESGILSRLIRLRHDVKKPFAVSIESGWKYDGFAKELFKAGIPAFRSAEAAALAVARCLSVIR